MCRIKEIKEFSVSFSLPAIVQKHQRQGTNHHPLIKILHHIIELPIGKRTAERRIQLQCAIDDIPNTKAFGRVHAKIKDQSQQHNIDTSFITQLEQRNEHYQFKRIDADVTDALKSDDAADLTEETNTLSDLFKKTLNNDKLTVKVESLKDADVASILTLSEQGRRMQDMMKMYAAGGMGGMDPNMFAADQTLTLNANNALVKYLFEHKDSEHSGMFAEQLYDLAMLSNQPLSAEAMTKFVKRSNDIMLLLTK